MSLMPMLQQLHSDLAGVYAQVLRAVITADWLPLVAIWGLETDFGSYNGSFPTLRALATLAYSWRTILSMGVAAALICTHTGLPAIRPRPSAARRVRRASTGEGPTRRRNRVRAGW